MFSEQSRTTTKLTDTSHTPAIRVMRVVDRRDAGTLLPHLHLATVVSLVWNDGWAAYRRVQRLSEPGVTATVRETFYKLRGPRQGCTHSEH